MAAVMKIELSTSQWDGLAPTGRGHELLVYWAPYRRGGNDVRSPVASGYLKEALDKAVDEEPRWLVMIDREIGRLARINYLYEKLVQRYYLEQLAMWQLVDKFERTPGFIRMSLCAVCDAVDRAIPGSVTRAK